MPESFSPLDRLSSLLRWVRGFPQQARFEATGLTLANGEQASPFHRIRYCSQALLSGAVPDAVTLQFVAIAFDKYVRSEGTLSLDEAFGLKSMPKGGNPARQFARTNKKGCLLFDMAMLLADNPSMSIHCAAEKVLQDDESIPIETLQREYTRLRVNKWVEALRGK